MTTISNLSSWVYTAQPTTTQGAQSSQVTGTDPDGDGDSSQSVKHGGHHHGHGQMQNALMQALQSLGLDTTQSTGSSTTSSSSSNTTTDNDSDSDGTSSATDSLKADMHKFMHALFQAVKADSSTGSNSSDPKASFAAGLSDLITQVSNGQAPADLQSAFSNLVTDLQGASSSSTSAGTSSSSTQITLQELLSKMQQDIGYNSNSNTAALGNVLTAVA